MAAELPGVAEVLETLAGVAWLANYLPSIKSYSDPPADLQDLEDAVSRSRSGTEIHHIVETQYNSDDENANSNRFTKEQLEGRDNKVRIPYWKHGEISDWYSKENERYQGQTPRQYLRGKSWEEQYEFGLKVLRNHGVLK